MDDGYYITIHVPARGGREGEEGRREGGGTGKDNTAGLKRGGFGGENEHRLS